MGTSAAIIGGAQAVGAIGSAYASAKAQQSQGVYQSEMAKVNATFAEEQSSEAIQAGNKSANRVESGAQQTMGSQRAALAAQGIDVDVGSAAQVQSGTQNQAALAELTIKNNAYLQAWGYKVQATNDIYSGKFAGMAANNAASSTLLTGGLQGVGYAAGGFRNNYGGYGSPNYGQGTGGGGSGGTPTLMTSNIEGGQ